MKRYIGLDLGAESISLVELAVCSETISIERRVRVDHNKNPQATLKRLLSDCNWEAVQSAAVTGRFSRQLTLPHVPLKQALCAGLRHVYGIEPTTLVSIGSHGFSVLELRGGDITVFRENSRCSQGTGNFLRQLVERFDMDIESASVLCESVTDPAPLSGRCPVILKTDMTHLANKGEGRERILAGLFDAVCENVRSLINPRKNPPRLVLAGGVCQSPRIRENFYRFAEQNGMQAMPWDPQISLYLEAIGAALVASESQSSLHCPTKPELRLPE